MNQELNVMRYKQMKKQSQISNILWKNAYLKVVEK